MGNIITKSHKEEPNHFFSSKKPGWGARQNIVK